MRILHIITQKPFATGSGVYLTGIMTALGQRHDQYLICGLNQGDTVQLPQMDHPALVDPVLFESQSLPFPVPGMSDVMPYRSTLYSKLSEEDADSLVREFFRKIDRALAEFAPDAVILEHLYLLTARTAAWIRRQPTGDDLPLIGICHGSELRQFENTASWHPEIQAGVQLLDRVISTHAEQAEVITDLLGVLPERIRILGSGYNDSIFNRIGRLPDLPESPLRIVYTGKLSRAKGVPELLAACAIVHSNHPLTLTLIGSGADPLETAQIEASAASQTYPVTLTGQLRQEEIARIYRTSHLFVLPSYYEGMPLVVPEALACGLAVAVTHLPGYAQWLEPFSDRVSLIDRPAMKRLDEPTESGREQFVQSIAHSIVALAEGLSSAGESDLASLSWGGLAQRMEGVLEELINGQ